MRKALVAMAVAAVLAVLITPAAHGAKQKVKVVIDGKTINMSPPGYIIGNRPMCPAEAYLEALGATIGGVPTVASVTAFKWGRRLSLRTDGRPITFGSRQFTPNAAGLAAVDGCLYIDLHFFGELMGFNVKWQNRKRTATLTSRPFTAPTVKVYWDSYHIRTSAPVYLDDGNVMCPAGEALGGLTGGDRYDSETRSFWLGTHESALQCGPDEMLSHFEGKPIELDRVPTLINGKPYIPLMVCAGLFDIDVHLDTAARTVTLSKKDLGQTSESIICDLGVQNAKVHPIPGGGVLVVGHAPGPPAEVVIATSDDDGDSWAVRRLPVPEGLQATRDFDALPLSSAEIAVYGRKYAAGESPDMPLWFASTAITTSGWRGTTTTGALPNTSQRAILDAVATPDGSLIYAAGFEERDGTMYAQMWRSVDRGSTWQTMCDANGQIRQQGGGATVGTGPATVIGGIGGVGGAFVQDRISQISLGEMAPDGTVWGWTDGKLVRIDLNGAVTMLPWPERALTITDIHAPTSQDVYVWYQSRTDTDQNRYWERVGSSDGGSTWSLGTTPYPADAGLLVDYVGPSISAWAVDETTDPTIRGWELRISTLRGSPGSDIRPLSGYHVQDMWMRDKRAVFLLVNRGNPRMLYCLRWSMIE